MKESLYRRLEEYSKTEYYPFHMPGHKRNMSGCELENAYHIDITEIDGFDNLHHAEGILLEAMNRASELYQSEETYFLVNGSTGGILSSISATVKKRGKILLARNCHKAAYHAVSLRELQPVYLYPPIQDKFGVYDSLNTQDVVDALDKDSDIEAIFFTSPTYDGVVSDVEKIVTLAHSRGIPVIVDEAHGAHFGFHEDFPKNSISTGADIVIHSVHKTLPSFTQTALLHVNGNLVDRKKLKRFLGIYQTSSPSYLLMAGIDSCISLVGEKGAQLFRKLSQELDDFYQQCKELKYLKLFQQEDAAYGYDKSKILISVKDTNMTGHDLGQLLLHKYYLQMEMEAPTYVVAIATIMDTEVGFHRLSKALLEIDRTMDVEPQGKTDTGVDESTGEEERRQQNALDMVEGIRGQAIYPISEAEEREKEEIPFEESENRISGEYIYLYPPGIPIITPGELVTGQIIALVNAYKKAQYALQGPEDYKISRLMVVK